jgi:hypothetical protein
MREGRCGDPVRRLVRVGDNDLPADADRDAARKVSAR